MQLSLVAVRLFFGLLVMLVPLSVQAAKLPDFTEIVKQKAPAVVRIETEQRSSFSRGSQNPLRDHPGIPEEFKRFFEQRGTPQEQQRQSLGSGFIISEDGYIVTNHHVVDKAENIIVKLNDRREFVAEIVGLDQRSDLALLKVEGKGLPTLELAADSELEVGEWVLAIGSPFGLDYSASAGIVSGKGRSLPTQSNENYVPFVQTDVAINRGNSGGPLFNLKGEVVGVNSQIYSSTGGSIGLSFAIPAAVVHNVVDQLKTSGTVARGWLGVSIQDVDKNLADSFGLDRPMGALVAELQAGSPAEQGGLLAGDIIIGFNGIEILRSADLPHAVGLVAPGSRVDIEVVRNKKRKHIRLKVGSLGGDKESGQQGNTEANGKGDKLGLIVEPLDARQREEAGISGGVMVVEVLSGGAAAEAGVLSGDLITLIGAIPIDSVATYRQIVTKLNKGSVPVRIIRRGRPMFIGIKLSN